MFYSVMSGFYFLVHFLLIFVLITLGSESLLLFEWGLNIGYYMNMDLMLDFMSLGFLNFVALITFAVMKYSYMYMGLDFNSKRFIILVNFFVLSMFILIISPGFLMIMLGWDGLGVTSFLLVIYYMNASSLVSGLVTIYLNRFGDFMMMLTFWLFYSGLNYSNLVFYSKMNVSVMVGMIILASMTKSAQLPFSSWLPAAMAAPTPVSSLVHSSTLVTAGVYLLNRFYYLVETSFLAEVLLWISLITCFGAGIIACYENDLKKLVAMSTLSQLGLMIYAFSMGEPFYSFYHMVCHALFKALLFLSCGLFIMNMYGSQDGRLMGKMGSISFIWVLMMFVSVLSLLGFPFFAGFFSKDCVIDFCLGEGPVLLVYVVLFLSCILTGVYGIKSLVISTFSFSLSNLNYLGIQGIVFILGMSILTIWSLVLGSTYFIFLEIMESAPFSIWMKIMGTIIVIMGMLFSFYLLWTKFLTLKGGKHFFNDVVFLNWVFGGFSSQSLESYLVLSMGEISWFLFVGPNSLFYWLMAFSENLLLSMSSLKISLFVVFFSVLLI